MRVSAYLGEVLEELRLQREGRALVRALRIAHSNPTPRRAPASVDA
jgi:hypothetical protein